jgi:ketosteroid isomerase-like protein
MALSGDELIELLRRNNEAINRGDFDTAIQLADPDIVYVRPGGLPELRGVEAVRAWMEPDAFESQRYELLDHEVEGNRILTRARTIARGAGSGIEMQIDALTVWTFNADGKVARVEAFLLHEEDAARRALQGD